MGKKADEKVSDFVDRVRRRYRLEKAILFGSRARGDQLNDSDYDVLLVSDDFKGIFFSQRSARMYEFWAHYPHEIEPLCYTHDEFEQKKKELGIVRQAVAEGISLL